MKKVVYFIIIIGLATAAIVSGYFWLEQNKELQTAKMEQTTIKIEKDSVMLERIKYHDKRNVVFKITNTGESPLLIKNVLPSCGCTNVTWDKNPIKAGTTTEIAVVFKPNSLGRFIKSIDVYCNTPQQLHQLKLLGEVDEK